ncbi:MAG: hypothetical protein LBS83_02540 [Holosporales bacterium]|jgi:hypothetical protein|nr:hypothetical protein [Holosporales bacterium]
MMKKLLSSVCLTIAVSSILCSDGITAWRPPPPAATSAEINRTIEELKQIRSIIQKGMENLDIELIYKARDRFSHTPDLFIELEEVRNDIEQAIRLTIKQLANSPSPTRDKFFARKVFPLLENFDEKIAELQNPNSTKIGIFHGRAERIHEGARIFREKAEAKAAEEQERPKASSLFKKFKVAASRAGQSIEESFSRAGQSVKGAFLQKTPLEKALENIPSENREQVEADIRSVMSGDAVRMVQNTHYEYLDGTTKFINALKKIENKRLQPAIIPPRHIVVSIDDFVDKDPEDPLLRPGIRRLISSADNKQEFTELLRRLIQLGNNIREILRINSSLAWVESVEELTPFINAFKKELNTLEFDIKNIDPARSILGILTKSFDIEEIIETNKQISELLRKLCTVDNESEINELIELLKVFEDKDKEIKSEKLNNFLMKEHREIKDRLHEGITDDNLLKRSNELRSLSYVVNRRKVLQQRIENPFSEEEIRDMEYFLKSVSLS